MLIEYKVANFKSIGHEIIFSMMPDDGIPVDENSVIEIETADGTAIKLLKKAVLFGANASGKTSFVESIDFLSEYLKRDTPSGEILSIVPFKGNFEDLADVTKYEVTFFSNKQIYKYILHLNSSCVMYEELLLLEKEEFSSVFIRSENGSSIDIVGSKFFSEEDSKIIEVLKNTFGEQQKAKSFLYKLHDNNVKLIEPAYKWLIKILSIFPFSQYAANELRIYKDEAYRQNLSKYLKKYDTGIVDIYTDVSMSLEEAASKYNMTPGLVNRVRRIAEESKGKEGERIIRYGGELLSIQVKNGEIEIYKIKNTHILNGYKVNFDLEDESSGTQRLFDLIPVLDMVDNVSVILVDELDRSLHTSLVKTFLEDMIKNLNHTQFIFTSHNVALMEEDMFRFDEIWFIQKNSEGETKMCSLSEYNLPEERKKNLIKDYLNGRFGGVPFIR